MQSRKHSNTIELPAIASVLLRKLENLTNKKKKYNQGNLQIHLILLKSILCLSTKPLQINKLSWIQKQICHTLNTTNQFVKMLEYREPVYHLTMVLSYLIWNNLKSYCTSSFLNSCLKLLPLITKYLSHFIWVLFLVCESTPQIIWSPFFKVVIKIGKTYHTAENS